jgi:hypothetical protein
MNGQTIQEIARKVRRIPPLHDRNERRQITRTIQKQIHGSPGTPVRLVYRDEDGQAHETVIRCTPRAGEVFQGKNLVPEPG